MRACDAMMMRAFVAKVPPHVSAAPGLWSCPRAAVRCVLCAVLAPAADCVDGVHPACLQHHAHGLCPRPQPAVCCVLCSVLAAAGQVHMLCAALMCCALLASQDNPQWLLVACCVPSGIMFGSSTWSVRPVAVMVSCLCYTAPPRHMAHDGPHACTRTPDVLCAMECPSGAMHRSRTSSGACCAVPCRRRHASLPGGFRPSSGCSGRCQPCGRRSRFGRRHSRLRSCRHGRPGPDGASPSRAGLRQKRCVPRRCGNSRFVRARARRSTIRRRRRCCRQ
jgi:hypothetical protein